MKPSFLLGEILHETSEEVDVGLTFSRGIFREPIELLRFALTVKSLRVKKWLNSSLTGMSPTGDQILEGVMAQVKLLSSNSDGHLVDKLKL